MTGPAATILVVDDEVQNRKLLETLLRPEGYVTLTAASGEEALAVIAQRAPDLILLDVMMPGMDGYQVASALKANPVTANIPIIMVTASIDRDSRLAGLNAGAEEFLGKPVDRGELWLRVRNLLRLKTLGDFLKNHSVVLEQEVQTRTADLLRCRSAMDATTDAIYLVDRSSMRFVHVNDTACRMHNRTRAELLALGPGEVLSTSRAELEHAYDAVIASGADAKPREHLRLRKDSSPAWVEVRIHAHHSGDHWIIVTLERDITERKLAEEKVRRLNRVYAVLSGINTLIVRVQDRQELFNEACRIAVEQGRFEMAWIGSLDPVTQVVTPVAWAGPGAKEYLEKTDSIAIRALPSAQGAVSRAIRELRPVYSNDMSIETGVTSLRRAEGLRRGYRSLMVLPLIVEGTAVGNLSLFTKEIDFFDEEELRLLTELAADISFALKNIGRQQKLDKLARIRSVSSEINASIVRIHERDALLRETCRIAAEHGKFGMVWIASVDAEKQEVRPIAWAGFSPEAARAVNWANIETVRGTLGAAILTRKPAVRNDAPPGEQGGMLRREALQKNYLSTVCLPLVVDNRVVALIALFAPGAGFFDDEELALLGEVAADISFALQAIEKHTKLEYLSYYDVLTGLPNRTLFHETLKKTLALASDRGWLVAVLCIDLDYFKNVNDTLGHAIGDELLTQFSSRLLQCVRIRDTVGRLGGDEFALILLMEDGQEGAAHVANKIREALRAPFDLKGHEVIVTASIGIAIHPSDASDPETLMKYADTAMYRAKQAGRDTFRFFTAQMNDEVMARLDLETALRKAFENGEFVLHYQPKVQLSTGRVAGLEALLRWVRPGHGLVPPKDFITVLEETGLIVRVGSWVVAAACRQIGLWMRSSIGPVQVSVNVSGRQFIEGDLHGDIVKALADNGIAANLLELEMTESSLMANTERTIAGLRNLKQLGVQISIDDFGTGYSSLAYLSRFPIDILKIDIAFIRDVTSNPDHAAIVLAIIRMAHGLKLDVVAEGVETAAQLAYLQRHHCDFIQGYYFSRPLPVPELEQMLREGKRLPGLEAEAGAQPGTLLLVDDDAGALALLQRLLREDGYRILSARSVAEGFELLALHPVQVIVCDQTMPGMNGTVFLDRVKDLYPDTFRIILSGHTDLEPIMDAINRGAIHRFYTRQWDDKLARKNIHEAFRHHRLLHDIPPSRRVADLSDTLPPGKSAAPDARHRDIRAPLPVQGEP